MNTTIAILLQAVTTLLLGVGKNNVLPVSVREQTVNIAEHSVQIATQAEAMPEISFAIPKNKSIWPNALDLTQTAYRGIDKKWVKVGNDLSFVDNSISFGDINNDGFDDAVVIVKRISSNGTFDYALAVMLNQDNILFNIADVPLGQSIQIFNHKIMNNEIVIDMQIGNGVRKVYTYQLLGNQVISL